MLAQRRARLWPDGGDGEGDAGPGAKLPFDAKQ
jgi:hypothetical protein